VGGAVRQSVWGGKAVLPAPTTAVPGEMPSIIPHTTEPLNPRRARVQLADRPASCRPPIRWPVAAMPVRLGAVAEVVKVTTAVAAVAVAVSPPRAWVAAGAGGSVLLGEYSPPCWLMGAVVAVEAALARSFPVTTPL